MPALPLRVSRTLTIRDHVADAIVHALDAEGGPLVPAEVVAALAVRPDDATEVEARLACGRAVADVFHRAERSATTLLERGLAQAALLFRAGLFFEVHEVLETVWHRLEGERKTFLQGLIQIAVGLHHLAHDNAAGAMSLFASGRAKLAPRAPTFEGVEVTRLLLDLVDWEAAAAAGRWPDGLDLPIFVVAMPDGARFGEPS